MSKKQITTIGILAHVDAGKTSLTECLLHQSGATQTMGNVDKGSAITDSLDMEKSRGISIKSASVRFSWNEREFQLLDTPGHIDFSAEVDRSLSVLDAVILVISAKEGIQAHTLNLWENLKERQLPVIVFVNKIDRAGVDLDRIIKEFEQDLHCQSFSFNCPDLSNPDRPTLRQLKDGEEFHDSFIYQTSLENLADHDEDFLKQYLENKVSNIQEILDKARQQVQKRSLFPVYYGSAKMGLGIDDLLNGMSAIFNQNQEALSTPSAKVFKIEFDPKQGRLAHIKCYGSAIKNKDSIFSQNLERDTKINQIYKHNLGRLEQVNELLCGEIGAVTSSDILLVGDVLGQEKLIDNFSEITQTVLEVEVVAQDEKNYQKLGEALEILNLEDPVLDFKWFKEEREFHLKILGPIQTEVLKESLVRRWNIEANFLPPKILYKETPSSKSEGFVRYWMPKPCWAIMTFIVEPGPEGSGIKFESKVRTSDISQKYINEVKRAIPWTLKQGIKGFEVTDISIILKEGSEHNVHSNPGDFLLATPMGIMRALENAGTDLLEPMYAFDIKAHQDLLGPITSDLNQMRADIHAPIFEAEYFTINGRVSVAQAMDYPIQFNATTSGKGRLKLVLDGYQKTESSPEIIRKYRGVSPLDESLWILHMRGAFRADER